MNLPHPPTVREVLWRGVRRRCGRCGERAQFSGWFRLHERCSCCGVRFAREEGFFTGVYLVNYTATAVLLVGMLMAYLTVSVAGDNGGEGLTAWMLGAVAIAVIVPAVTYPIAATTWAAVDLLLRPLEPLEEAEAALWARGDHDEGSHGEGRPGTASGPPSEPGPPEVEPPQST